MSSYQPKQPPHPDLQRDLWRIKLPELATERALDALPGCVVLLALAVTIIGAVLVPRLTVYAAGVIALYLALRLSFVALANLRGLRAIRRAEATDWRVMYEQAGGPDALAWDAVLHVVILPNFHEPEELLAHSLARLAQMPEAESRMAVLLAMEEAEPGSRQKAQRLQAQFAGQFAGVYATVHPAGLTGERQCKSANLAWAGRWIRQELVEKQGRDAGAIVVTTMDADTEWHPRYFTALTCAFATDPNRHHRFWQAPIHYHGRIYESHAVMRSINAYATSIEVAYLSAPWWLSMPISSYSVSLRLLETCAFWDPDVIADEWHMYIKAFFARRGELAIAPIYLPFLATPVHGKTLLQTIKRRYAQTLRHAWGSKELGYTISCIISQPGTPPGRAMWLLLSVAHDVLLSGAGWIAVTAGSQLPPLMHGWLREEYLHRPLIYPQTLLLEIAFIILTLVSIMFLRFDFRARPPRQTPPTTRERLLEALGLVLLPVYALVFVTIPLLQAQMMLLLGKSLDFHVTRKL